MGRDENVVEAPHQAAHDAMDKKRGFRVDVEAIDVLWLVDGAQESLRLLDVFVHGNTGGKDTHMVTIIVSVFINFASVIVLIFTIEWCYMVCENYV